MTAINQPQTLTTELVLQERVTSNEFRITEIVESVQQRFVRVDVELGPFTEVSRSDGKTEQRGSGRRAVQVWSGDEYDAIRDTWTNTDLLAAVTSKLQ